MLRVEAIYHTLLDDISEVYPSTILRTHSNATLFIDPNSAQRWLEATKTK